MDGTDGTEKLRGTNDVGQPEGLDRMVVHPPHYQSGGMEAIQVIEAFAHDNFWRGAALKYLLRAGRKGDTIQDLQKAVWMVEREIGWLRGRESRLEAPGAGNRGSGEAGR